MDRILCMTFIFVLLLPCHTVRGTQELSHILKGVQNKYAELPGFAARYTREVISKSVSVLGNQLKGDLATGQLFFKPPYFLRLEQETPRPETLVANNEAIWWYIPEKKRAYRYPSGEFGKELRLLSDIFRGLIRVEERFDVSMPAGDEHEEYRIELTPDPPWEEIDMILLTVTREYLIKEVDILNRLGGRTRFLLEDLVKKDSFKPGFFEFVVPEGVEVSNGGG